MWDDFWFSNTTRMLLYTNGYTLGKEQLELTSILCQPEKNIHLNRIAKQKVLGFTVSYEDIIEDTVIWES
jgi:hypothetical protein